MMKLSDVLNEIQTAQPSQDKVPGRGNSLGEAIDPRTTKMECLVPMEEALFQFEKYLMDVLSDEPETEMVRRYVRSLKNLLMKMEYRIEHGDSSQRSDNRSISSDLKRNPDRHE